MHDPQREKQLQKELVLVHHTPFFTNHPLPFHETILKGGSNYAYTLSFSEKGNYCILQGGKKKFISANPFITAFRRLRIDRCQLNDFSSISQLNWYLDHHFKRCEE